MIRKSTGLVWLQREVVETIEALADHCYPYEVGGMLLGYCTDDPHLVVTHIIGPGPLSKSTRHGFEPDDGFQQDEITRLFEQTKGTALYLGDWHTHPHGRPITSSTDRKTLHQIARTTDGAVAPPIMGIWGGYPARWTRALWQPSKYSSWWPTCGVVEVQSKVFD